MLSHHLPQFIARLGSISRFAFGYGHAASRAIIGAFFHLQSLRDAFRVALRESGLQVSVGSRRPKGQAPFLIHYHNSPDPRGRITARQIARLVKAEPELHAISSHQATPPPPRILGRKVITSILIRDPIARIGSMYAFERAQQANTIGALKAKELDFRRYVEWRLEATPSVLCNFQVIICSGRHRTECSKRDLETAIIRLDSIDIVGTVTRYPEWLAVAQSYLQQYFPKLFLSLVHHNRSTEERTVSESEILARLTQALGPAITRDLLARNELDMTLHQVADSLLTRRLAEREIAIKLQESYSQAIGATARESSSQPDQN